MMPFVTVRDAAFTSREWIISGWWCFDLKKLQLPFVSIDWFMIGEERHSTLYVCVISFYPAHPASEPILHPRGIPNPDIGILRCNAQWAEQTMQWPYQVHDRNGLPCHQSRCVKKIKTKRQDRRTKCRAPPGVVTETRWKNKQKTLPEKDWERKERTGHRGTTKTTSRQSRQFWVLVAPKGC